MKNNLNIVLVVLVLLVIACTCPKSEPKSVVNTNTANVANAAPTPPPTFAELKEKGEKLLKFEKGEYLKEDLTQFDEVMTPLRDIPKEDKNYKEAQKLHKKLIDKTAPIAAEIVVLGARPSEIELKIAFNHYLRSRLNDYDSSEYVNYTPAQKVYVKKEPFWVSILTLRAKNGFGAYMVKDVTMYIRNKEVVLVNGL